LSLIGQVTWKVAKLAFTGFILIGTCLMVFGLFATGNRGGIFGLIFGTLLWAGLWLSSSMSVAGAREEGKRPKFFQSAVLGIVIVMGLFVFYKRHVANEMTYENERRWRLTLTRDAANPLADEAGTGRVGLWRASFWNFVEKPIFGHGPMEHVGGIVPHNTALQVAVEGGIAASIPFHLAYWIALVGLWRHRRRLLRAGKLQETRLIDTLIVVIISIMFVGIGGNFMHDKDPWVYLALASIINKKMAADPTSLGIEGMSPASQDDHLTRPSVASRRLRVAGSGRREEP
jgi:O-antigen ligase